MKTLTKEKKTVIGYIIIVISIVIFGFLIASALVLKEEPYDTETLCRDDISAHTIIVLDKTDTLSNNQQKYVHDYINKEKEKLIPFEKFSIFALTENCFMSPEPIFSKCNPGTAKTANSLYQNPQMIQKRFNDFFSDPLQKNMNIILSENKGSKSPIFEMIKELSLRDDFSDEIEKRSLIIISDMMHHTPEYSHYKDTLDYNSFSIKSYAYEIASNLNTVNVKIVYLLRDNLGNIQGKRHLLFWKNYFEDMGAQATKVRIVN